MKNIEVNFIFFARFFLSLWRYLAEEVSKIVQKNLFINNKTGIYVQETISDVPYGNFCSIGIVR